MRSRALRAVPPAFPRRVLPALPVGTRLDLGCAEGALTALLGPGAVGADRDRGALRAARAAGTRVLAADLDRGLPFRTGAADAVLLSHALEHVREPPRLLAECARVLRPGGTLAVAVPSPWTLSMLWTGDRYYARHPEHRHAFSPRALGRLLEAAGFGRPRFIPDPPGARKLAAIGLFPVGMAALRLVPLTLLPRIAPAVWAVAGRR